MKKKLHFLSLLITISFFSCDSAVKNPIVSISSIATDFPTSEELEFKSFNRYDILTDGPYLIDDSILWHFGRGEHDLGFCYDLNTGEKLSMIASIGKAAYEIIDLNGVEIINDVVCLHEYPNIIKTIAKKDIIENKPMNERKFSVTTAPDSIDIKSMAKLPNGSVLATINSTYNSYHLQKYEINKKTVALFNSSTVKAYETINYNSHDVGQAKENEIDANELIKYSYANGIIAVKGDDKAAFSVEGQFALYTFDINRGKVGNEKRYTKMQRDGGQGSQSTTNDLRLEIVSMKSNDKYILCAVTGYFSEEDKELNRRKNALFVFDWSLNPIKRFNLPDKRINYYTVSNDCKSVYFRERTDENLTLYKADLNI